MGNLYATTPGQSPGVARIYIYIFIFLLGHVKCQECQWDPERCGHGWPTNFCSSIAHGESGWSNIYCFQEDFSDIAKSGDAVLVLSSVKVLVEHFWVNSKKVGKNPLMNWTSPFTYRKGDSPTSSHQPPCLHCPLLALCIPVGIIWPHETIKNHFSYNPLRL